MYCISTDRRNLRKKKQQNKEDFKMTWLFNDLTMSVHTDGYSKKRIWCYKLDIQKRNKEIR